MASCEVFWIVGNKINLRKVYKIENLSRFMRLRDWKEVIDLHFPDAEVSEEARQTTRRDNEGYLVT